MTGAPYGSSHARPSGYRFSTENPESASPGFYEVGSVKSVVTMAILLLELPRAGGRQALPPLDDERQIGVFGTQSAKQSAKTITTGFATAWLFRACVTR
jgi:hypothetical protein